MANITNQMKTGQVNTFTGGINTDLNPVLQPKDTLTDCVNGTIITYNGNENMLQNDMGNYKLKNAKLPEGYIPLGMKEYGGIIYLILSNPNTGKVQLGSYPSPQTSPEEVYDVELEDNTLYEISPIKIETFEGDISNFDFFSEEAEKYFYSNLDTSKSKVIFTPDFGETSTFEVGDRYAIVSDELEENVPFQELKYFSINKEKTKYSLNKNQFVIDNLKTNNEGEVIENIENCDRDDSDLKEVSWQFPGWVGCEYVVDNLISHDQDVKVELKQIDSEDRIFDTIEKNEEGDYILKKSQLSNKMLSITDSFETIPTNEIWLELPLGKENLVVDYDNLDEYNIESIDDSNYFVEIKFKSPVYSVEFLEDIVQGVADKIIIPSTILVIPENIPTYMLFVNHHIIKLPETFKWVKKLYTPKEIDQSYFDNIVYLTDTDKPLDWTSFETTYENGRGVITIDDFKTILQIDSDRIGQNLLKSIVITEIESLPNQWCINYEPIEYVHCKTISLIGEECFRNCVNLKEIVLGNVETIANGAFIDCKKIRYFEIDSDKTVLFGSRCFLNCSGKLYLNSNYTVISPSNNGLRIFYNCWFKEVVIGDNVSTIQPCSFSYCGIQSITFSSKLHEIGDRAFENATKLNKLEFFSYVILGKSSFENCIGLEEITFSERAELGLRCLWNTGVYWIEFLKDSQFATQTGEENCAIKTSNGKITINFHGNTNFNLDNHLSEFSTLETKIYWYSTKFQDFGSDYANLVLYVGNKDNFNSYTIGKCYDLSKFLQLEFDSELNCTRWISNGGQKWCDDNEFELNHSIAKSIKIFMRFDQSLENLSIPGISTYSIKKIVIPENTKFTSSLWSKGGINYQIQEVEVNGGLDNESISADLFSNSNIKNLMFFNISEFDLSPLPITGISSATMARISNIVFPETLVSIIGSVDSEPSTTWLIPFENIYLQSQVLLNNEGMSIDHLKYYVRNQVNVLEQYLDDIKDEKIQPYSMINFKILSEHSGISSEFQQMLKQNGFFIKNSFKRSWNVYEHSVFKFEINESQGNLEYVKDMSSIKWIEIPNKISKINIPKLGCSSLYVNDSFDFSSQYLKYLYLNSDSKVTNELNSGMLVWNKVSGYSNLLNDHYLSNTSKILINEDVECQIIEYNNKEEIVFSPLESVDNINTLKFIKFDNLMHSGEEILRIYSINLFQKTYKINSILEINVPKVLPTSADIKYELKIVGKNTIKVPKNRNFDNLKLYVCDNNGQINSKRQIYNFNSYNQVDFEYFVTLIITEIPSNVLIKSIPYLYKDESEDNGNLLIFDNYLINEIVELNPEKNNFDLLRYQYTKDSVTTELKSVIFGRNFEFNFYKIESAIPVKKLTRTVDKISNLFILENLELDENSIYIFEIYNKFTEERIRRFLFTYDIKKDSNELKEISDYNNLYYDDFDIDPHDYPEESVLFNYKWMGDSKFTSKFSSGNAFINVDSDEIFPSIVCNNFENANSVTWKKNKTRNLIIEGTDQFTILNDSSNSKLKCQLIYDDGSIEEIDNFELSKEIPISECSSSIELTKSDVSVPIRQYLIKGSTAPLTLFNGQSDTSSLNNNRFGWSEKIFKYMGYWNADIKELNSGSHLLVEKCDGGKEVKLSHIKNGEEGPKKICSYENDVEEVLKTINNSQLFISLNANTSVRKSGFVIPVPLIKGNNYKKDYRSDIFTWSDKLNTNSKWYSGTRIFDKKTDVWKSILIGVGLAAAAVLTIVTLGGAALIGAGMITALSLGTLLTITGGAALGWAAVLGASYGLVELFKQKEGLHYETYAIKAKGEDDNLKLVLPLWDVTKIGNNNHPWYFIKEEGEEKLESLLATLETHLYFYPGDSTTLYNFSEISQSKILREIRITVEVLDGTRFLDGKSLEYWDNSSKTLIGTESNNFKFRNQNSFDISQSIFVTGIDSTGLEFVNVEENTLKSDIGKETDGQIHIDWIDENVPDWIVNFAENLRWDGSDLYYNYASTPNPRVCFGGNRGDYKIDIEWDGKDLLGGCYYVTDKDGFCPIAYPLDPTDDSILNQNVNNLDESHFKTDIPDYLKYLINYD